MTRTVQTGSRAVGAPRSRHGSRRAADARERGAVAMLPLATVPARARLVATPPGVFGGVVRHQLSRRTAGGQQASHRAHRAFDVVEEQLVAGAEIVLPALAVGGGREAVLGAAAVAREAHVAVKAVLGQGVALVLAEPHLLGGGDQLRHRGFDDVAE